MLEREHIEYLCGFGKMKAGEGDFAKDIDSYGGKETAEFAARAIENYPR